VTVPEWESVEIRREGYLMVPPNRSLRVHTTNRAT
jgi:hypothetical protein